MMSDEIRRIIVYLSAKPTTPCTSFWIVIFHSHTNIMNSQQLQTRSPTEIQKGGVGAS